MRAVCFGLFVLRAVLAAAAGADTNQFMPAGPGSYYFKAANLLFHPVHYRPVPEKTSGLASNRLLLDGAWLLDAAPGDNVRAMSLSGPAWAPFKVPGQWLQQGFDVPQDQPVAVAKEFVIPKEWAGNRIVLRFDGLHAGTTCWLNGLKLGYTENLFTPVEWDITEAARVGQTNRLDLQMKVATVSEKLSYSSGYAFHNLGGIDRSVRVFALPPTHIRQLHLDAGLDADCRDGDLQMNLVLESEDAPAQGLALLIELRDPSGKRIEHSLPRVAIGPFRGAQTIHFVTRVAKPLPWSAEKPCLYRLALELRQRGAVLERVERNVGFRKIELRGRQLYVNGHRVKVAGACHHETDPL
ncbi:MAG TPA: hypothetical protein VN829_00430, partial [Dongiaceae bacterium]|nr:hypothetical protein [Dongiaceae bacterium]